MDTATLAARDKRSATELAVLYRATLEVDPGNRLALVHLESIVRRAGASDDLAALEERIAAHFDDPHGKAAFLTRAGETLAELGKRAEAVRRFARAADALPGYLPALTGWHQTALDGELWSEVAEAAIHKARLGGEPKILAALHHFAGVALMDKARASEPAIATFRRALVCDSSHLDSFLRLRILLDDNAEELAMLHSKRLEIELDPAAQVELHRVLGEHYSNVGERKVAKKHYRSILTVNPADVRAHAAIADIASENADWQDAVDALLARVPLENDPKILKTLHYRLAVIYADHDVPLAVRALQRALSCKPGDEESLIRLTDLAIIQREWQLALDTCKQLFTTAQHPDKRTMNLHRAATIFAQGFGDQEHAEQMLGLAFDSQPTSTEGLRLLVQFYKDTSNPTGLLVQMNRVAGMMRSRVAQDVKDGAAYRIIARAIAETDGDHAASIARAAAELAQLLGAGGEPEQRLIAGPRVEPALIGPGADDVLSGRGVRPELLHVFRLCGEAISKHVGIDLTAYGLSRKDRVRADQPVAAIARDVAMRLGFTDIDVYVCTRQPHVMVAEPTNPVSLVIGAAIVASGAVDVRFAAGAALKLAQLSLAIPARLPVDELGALCLALLRLFQPDFEIPGVSADEANAQMPRLRRLISTSLYNEVRPFALAVESFNHHVLARDLRVAGLRAGFVVSGSLLPGLGVLAKTRGTDLPSVLDDPLAQGLIDFALSDDRT